MLITAAPAWIAWPIASAEAVQVRDRRAGDGGEVRVAGPLGVRRVGRGVDERDQRALRRDRRRVDRGVGDDPAPVVGRPGERVGGNRGGAREHVRLGVDEPAAERMGERPRARAGDDVAACRGDADAPGAEAARDRRRAGVGARADHPRAGVRAHRRGGGVARELHRQLVRARGGRDGEDDQHGEDERTSWHEGANTPAGRSERSGEAS
jgi:hypothetical protein